MKTRIFILLTIFILAVGALSFTVLLSNSHIVKKHKKIYNLFSKTETYKSNDKNTNTVIELNYKDSTYNYQENYIMKPGDDVGYHFSSKGKFKVDKDLFILFSYMPSNDLLANDIHNLTKDEILKNKFSYIYPVDEKTNGKEIKIYFDNIAEIDDYKAFTIINDQLSPLKIIERKHMEEQKTIKTKKDDIFLFHYIIVERPINNKLLITNSKTGPKSESFMFDLNKIPYDSFHFFTRIYWSYYDFTGVKFKRTSKGLKKISEPEDNRYSENYVLNSDFVKK